MKTLAEIIQNKHSRLGQLVASCQTSINLSKLFTRIIDATWAKHCKLGSYQDGILHLLVTSSAWATRLHYGQRDIIKMLKVQPEFRTIRKISLSLVPLNTFSSSGMNSELANIAVDSTQSKR